MDQKLNLCHKNITDSVTFKFGSKGQIYVHFNSTHELNIAKSIANKQHPTSGYDDDFLKAVDQDCQYPICHLPLREPFQTRSDHRCCEECINERIEGTSLR